MPFFDWLEAGGIRPSWFKGSYNVTIGDVLNGTFGAGHTHIFGADVKLVCDPEDLLVGQLEKVLPLTSALLSGVGGATTFVYGANTSATYVGPQMAISRAKHVDKTSDNVIAHKRDAQGKDTDELDKVMAVAVSVLSVLLCATGAALDLVIRFKYEELQDVKTDEDKEHYEELIETLKIASYTATGRLMALLKYLEEHGCWAEFCEEWVKLGEKVSEYLKSAGEAIASGLETAGRLIQVLGMIIEEAVKDGMEALGRVLPD